MSFTRYPLCWPVGRPRTPAHRRERPKFKVDSFTGARDRLLAELRRLGAAGVILSTNVELRGDGLPYAGRRNPDDPGVAVFFKRRGKDVAFACDRWHAVEENMRAIADAIECIRTIERRGTVEMVDAAFAGFAALPAHVPPAPWRHVLGLDPNATLAQAEDAFRRLAMQHHPDRGGSAERMQELNGAIERARRDLRATA